MEQTAAMTWGQRAEGIVNSEPLGGASSVGYEASGGQLGDPVVTALAGASFAIQGG